MSGGREVQKNHQLVPSVWSQEETNCYRTPQLHCFIGNPFNERGKGSLPVCQSFWSCWIQSKNAAENARDQVEHRSILERWTPEVRYSQTSNESQTWAKHLLTKEEFVHEESGLEEIKSSTYKIQHTKERGWGKETVHASKQIRAIRGWGASRFHER